MQSGGLRVKIARDAYSTMDDDAHPCSKTLQFFKYCFTFRFPVGTFKGQASFHCGDTMMTPQVMTRIKHMRYCWSFVFYTDLINSLVLKAPENFVFFVRLLNLNFVVYVQNAASGWSTTDTNRPWAAQWFAVNRMQWSLVEQSTDGWEAWLTLANYLVFI